MERRTSHVVSRHARAAGDDSAGPEHCSELVEAAVFEGVSVHPEIAGRSLPSALNLLYLRLLRALPWSRTPVMGVPCSSVSVPKFVPVPPSSSSEESR